MGGKQDKYDEHCEKNETIEMTRKEHLDRELTGRKLLQYIYVIKLSRKDSDLV